MENVTPLRIADVRGESSAQLLSLDGECEWFGCKVQHNSGPVITDAAKGILSGMSGSPILAEDGSAIAVVSVAGDVSEPHTEANPRLAYHLPTRVYRGVCQLYAATDSTAGWATKAVGASLARGDCQPTMENCCAQVAILDGGRQMPAYPWLLGATDPCARRSEILGPLMPIRCRKFSQPRTTAHIRPSVGARLPPRALSWVRL